MSRAVEDASRAVDDAESAVRRRWSGAARTGLILGTGLGDLSRAIAADAIIPFADIPHFPTSTALSHSGRLVCGRLDGAPVVALDGRCHLYEGYSTPQIVLPVQLMARLGVERLIATNASGGLNPKLRGGHIVVVTSHVNLMGRRLKVSPESAPRESNAWNVSCDRGAAATIANPYDESLADLVLDVARRHDIDASRGVYVAMSGPNYETRAEYRFLRRLGADVVGMSTVPEVLAAAQLGLRTLVLSVVTNVAKPDVRVHTTAQEVVDVASAAAPRLDRLIRAALLAE